MCLRCPQRRSCSALMTRVQARTASRVGPRVRRLEAEAGMLSVRNTWPKSTLKARHHTDTQVTLLPFTPAGRLNSISWPAYKRIHFEESLLTSAEFYFCIFCYLTTDRCKRWGAGSWRAGRGSACPPSRPAPAAPWCPRRWMRRARLRCSWNEVGHSTPRLHKRSYFTWNLWCALYRP